MNDQPNQPVTGGEPSNPAGEPGAKPDIATQLLDRFEAFERREAEYRKANNEQMARFRRQLGGSDEPVAKVEPKSSGGFDPVSMARYLEARAKAAPELLSQVEGLGLSVEQQVAILAVATKSSSQRDAAGTQPSAGPGRSAPPAQANPQPHPRTFAEYAALPKEARMKLDADATFELDALPSR